MTGVFKEKATLGQGDGSEVELIVSGTDAYATYETVDGFPAVYDDDLELFCFAELVDGRFRSTKVRVDRAPPAGVQRHAVEAGEVRAARIEEHDAKRHGTAPRSPEEERS